MLGLGEQVRFTVSPMEMEYLPTGQRLLFLGAEDPGALKSLKPPFGYFGLIHFEEWDQFGGEKETRSIRQSVLRGGDRTWCFMTFNPPLDRNHFANRAMIPGGGAGISTGAAIWRPPEAGWGSSSSGTQRRCGRKIPPPTATNIWGSPETRRGRSS